VVSNRFRDVDATKIVNSIFIHCSVAANNLKVTPSHLGLSTPFCRQYLANGGLHNGSGIRIHRPASAWLSPSNSWALNSGSVGLPRKCSEPRRIQFFSYFWDVDIVLVLKSPVRANSCRHQALSRNQNCVRVILQITSVSPSHQTCLQKCFFICAPARFQPLLTQLWSKIISRRYSILNSRPNPSCSLQRQCWAAGLQATQQNFFRLACYEMIVFWHTNRTHRVMQGKHEWISLIVLQPIPF